MTMKVLCVSIATKIVSNFVLLYYVANYSFLETITICSILLFVAIVVATLHYYIRLYEIEMEKVFETLEDQNQYLKSLISSISDVLMLVTRDFTIQYMKNDFMGKPAKSFHGVSLWDVIRDEESKREARVALEQVFTTGKDASWNWNYRDKEKNFYFFAKATGVTKNNKVIYATILSSDITDRRLSLQRKLEAERETIISKAKSDFISSMSHEIRNPLQSIVYSLQLLSMTELNSVWNSTIS
jgi:signal transduction histidine kinase